MQTQSAIPNPQSTILRVAAIHSQVVSGEPKKNSVRAEALLNEAAAGGAQAALHPELWTTGYSLDRLDGLAKEYGAATLQFLQDTAARLHMAIIGGSFAVKHPDGVYSTCHIIGSDGALLGSYSKEHLFPLLNEPQYLRPGAPGSVTDTPFGKWST